MKQLLLLVLVSCTTVVFAEIYKSTDKQGNITYSDKETPESTEIEVPEPLSIPLPKPGPKEEPPATEQKFTYKIFSITSPTNDETLYISSGNVPVSVLINPALDIKNGHRITYYLDNNARIKNSILTSNQFTNVPRGTHTIKAEVINDKKEIINSDTVTIHLKRRSEQHKNPTGTPPGPRKKDGSAYTPGPSSPDGAPYKPGPVLTPTPSP